MGQWAMTLGLSLPAACLVSARSGGHLERAVQSGRDLIRFGHARYYVTKYLIIRSDYWQSGGCILQEPPGYFNLWTFGLVMLSGALNFCQNLVTSTLIHKLTALSYAVANCTKRIIIIGASLVALRNPVTPLNLVGMMLAIVGVLGYNRVSCLAQTHRCSFFRRRLHPVGSVSRRF